jgi:hypothetical protein
MLSSAAGRGNVKQISVTILGGTEKFWGIDWKSPGFGILGVPGRGGEGSLDATAAV